MTYRTRQCPSAVDMSLAANSKPSSADELLMARRRKRRRVREAGHARCLQPHPRVLPRPRALTLCAPRGRTPVASLSIHNLNSTRENEWTLICTVDLETAPVRLHAPLRSTVSLASPIILLSRSSSSPGMGAVQAPTLPPLTLPHAPPPPALGETRPRPRSLPR
ncbi:hypothetical protein FIBSPDRAFT_68322 [Athelia psychrophila]|uniref:Uncharacterized protein n=1 Tax=Athelia psychrophila TaxID=1759441 RepID=A0A166EQF1_9AGAM|nr:hypothetical protein FIBSPDRAFT_68322 [Fibularhizoctonia sp. CBS 109695]